LSTAGRSEAGDDLREAPTEIATSQATEASISPKRGSLSGVRLAIRFDRLFREDMTGALMQ